MNKNQEIFNAFLNRGEAPLDYEKAAVRDHKKRIEAILKGESPPPYEVEIQPSSICNLKCEHCFGKDCKRLSNCIGKKEIREIAEKMNDFQENGFKIEVAKFCGTTGEPLVNPVIAEGITIFKELGKKVIVFTNGLWMDKRVYNNGKCYLDYILEADKLNLSLDAGSDETFLKIKRVDGFRRIIKSLEKLVEKRNNNGSKLNIVVSYVIGKDNYNEVAKTAGIMKSIGADEIVFRIDFTDTNNLKNLSSKINENLDKAREYSNPDFKIVSAYSKEEISGADSEVFKSYGKKCFNHHFWACIGPDCNLYACGHRTHGGVKSYGSLLENTFAELWTGKNRAENIKKLPDESCAVCSPSSARRNVFITYLESLGYDEAKMLMENASQTKDI